MAVRRTDGPPKAHGAAEVDAPKGKNDLKKAKGQQAAESRYDKEQCKPNVVYKLGSPCGRKLLKEALQSKPLHGESIQGPPESFIKDVKEKIKETIKGAGIKQEFSQSESSHVEHGTFQGPPESFIREVKEKIKGAGISLHGESIQGPPEPSIKGLPKKDKN